MDINQRLTEELKKQILAAETLVAVEDLYRPYRPKRRTRATIAKEKGLESLAALITLVIRFKNRYLLRFIHLIFI